MGNSHYCKCPSDYTGSYCDKQVDYCEDKPCRNGATCRGYVGGYQCDVRAFVLFFFQMHFLCFSQQSESALDYYYFFYHFIIF